MTAICYDNIGVKSFSLDDIRYVDLHFRLPMEIMGSIRFDQMSNRSVEKWKWIRRRQ